MLIPDNPNVYHILHIDRLVSVLSDGKLLSDAIISKRSSAFGTNIGMPGIKERRLSLEVGSLSRGTVGQYVPFYFCPRSVMLYLLHMSNNIDLKYRGGQKPIIHLVSDFDSATKWADENSHLWTFTASNAGAYYTEFYFTKDNLNKLNWDAIPNMDFKSQEVKEAKQSEFLVMNSFPWSLVKEIGVIDESTKKLVDQLIKGQIHKPLVVIHREWYY